MPQGLIFFPVFGYMVRISAFVVAFANLHPATAQHPDVHEEPFHRPLHEYGPFRYLNVFASPGDTTAIHSHRLPILYLCISGSEVWLDEEGANPRRTNLPTGWIGSDTYSDSAVFNHRFSVTGDSDLHIIAVERKVQSVRHSNSIESEPIFAEDGFNVYAFSGENLHHSGNDMTSSPILSEFPAVLYKGTATSPTGKKYGPGDLLIPGNEPLSFEDNAVLWLVVPTQIKGKR
jgi:hypothetical protein